MMFTCGSLFSGIGGIDLAFQAAGFSIVWQVEIDDYCQKVLAKHWPEVARVSDIFNADKATIDTAASLTYNSRKVLQEDEMAAHRKDYSLAVELYKDGLSLADVAGFYGITRQAMWKILKRRNVEMRDQKRYGEENHFWRGTTAHDRSQNLVERAIEKGLIIRRDSCEQCNSSYTFSDGRSAIQAHHDDYNKPLDVRWLCQKCHHEWHKNHKAVEFNGGDEGSQIDGHVDVIVAGFP